jgi:hypothetical protein
MKAFVYISHQSEGIGVWAFNHKEQAQHAFLVDVLDTSGELGIPIELSNEELLAAAWSSWGFELGGTSPITMYLKETS